MLKRHYFYFANLFILIICFFTLSGFKNSNDLKKQSVFYSPKTIAKIRSNIQNDVWAQDVKSGCVENSKHWLNLTDDELWSLMFGNTITRSWMVWSNGHCPTCKESVPMYNWLISPIEKPWKVQCPHCNEVFPKNDFHKYYISGMDEQYVFQPELADKSLLFNAEHPNSDDPLHNFGVDDGEGYVNGSERWRFIGAYLIYGQWKKLIIEGISNLATAYIMTGDAIYAHKAAILLDRIADLYPTFSFMEQAVSYEKKDPIIGHGYVSVWHDACRETRALVLAYDMIFDAIKEDKQLVKFLSQKAKQHKLGNPKKLFSDVQQNIENNLLRDPLKNRRKIESNFPNTDVTFAVIHTVLDWTNNREKVMKAIDSLIEKGTAVDGLSGEKGLIGYSSTFPRVMAEFLSLYNRLEPGFLKKLLKQHPGLKQTFRFHVDTWINEEYYPKIGDTDVFAQKNTKYPAAKFSNEFNFATNSFTSYYSLFWKLFEITDDSTYIKILYKANNNSVSGLPFDILETDKSDFQQKVQNIINKTGTEIKTKSVNKKNWCLALLKSGKGKNQRTLWLDYDIGGNHCHANGMNIGLFAYGLDLLPGFGYPAVQFGGWHTKKAYWYRRTAAHNTVVVDGEDQIPTLGIKETEPLEIQLNPLKNNVRGKTTLWACGKQLKVIRASGRELYQKMNLSQYERTVALIDISDTDSYILDIFRVIGGKDHAKFMHGYPGKISTENLSVTPIDDYGFNTIMKNFIGDDSPMPGWSATWEIEDYYNYLPKGKQIFLKYTDFSKNVTAAIAETWVAFGFKKTKIVWIPSLMIRKQSENSAQETTFAGIIEPYETSSNIKQIKRVDLVDSKNEKLSDMNIAVEVELVNGCFDYIIAVDVEKSSQRETVVKQSQWNLSTDAEFCYIRLNRQKKIERIALANGSFIKFKSNQFNLKEITNFVEVSIKNEKPILETGAEGIISDFNLQN